MGALSTLGPTGEPPRALGTLVFLCLVLTIALCLTLPRSALGKSPGWPFSPLALARHRRLYPLGKVFVCAALTLLL